MADLDREGLDKLLEMAKEGSMARANIECPACHENIPMTRKALFSENKLTFKICLTEGHMLQASSLGGYIKAGGELLQAAAEEMGYRIEVLVPDVRMSDNEIAIDFCSVRIDLAPTDVAQLTDQIWDAMRYKRGSKNSKLTVARLIELWLATR